MSKLVHNLLMPQSTKLKLSAVLVRWSSFFGTNLVYLNLYLELEELKATIPALQAQIELFAENIEEISATIPSQSLLVTLQATTQKAADGLAQASKDIQENSLELRTIRTDAEKGKLIL